MLPKQSYFTQQDLMHHAKHPLNYGLLQQHTFLSEQHNPSCGDSITICGVIQNGEITALGFEGKGCMLSLAMGSKLTEWLKGKPVETIHDLGIHTVQDILQLELGPNRIQCGMLSINALKRALEKAL